MALTCPQCGAALHEVAAPGTSGYLLVLDQCAACGGIWCDRWELFPLSTDAAQRLDGVDREKLWKPISQLDREMACPRCKAPMFHFHDRILPPDVRIERCRNCDGMWLNRGELRRLKKGAATSLAPSHAISEADLDRLALATRDPKSWPRVSNLSDAFSAKADADAAPAARSALLTSGAWLVARFLMHVLLRI